MACYLVKTPKASIRDYHLMRSMGYTGTFERYNDMKRGTAGVMFMCGDFGDHCADCMGVAESLCDYPVGEGKTCDRPMCDDHAHRIGLDIHYCDDHQREWEKFKTGGGVEKTLKNVVPLDGK